MSTNLVDMIARYCAENGIAETTFGRLAVNDGKFVGRLRGGGRCWPETAEKIERFMRHHNLKSTSAVSAARSIRPSASASTVRRCHDEYGEGPTANDGNSTARGANLTARDGNDPR